MLRKLMKYEIKATARTFLIMFAAIISLSVINRILMSDSVVKAGFVNTGLNEMIFGIVIALTMIFYIVAIAGTILSIMILMVMRFYKSLLGDEGYLSFSLPVKPWQHLVSKLLVGALWLFTGVVVIGGSIFILLSHPFIIESIANELNHFFGVTWPRIVPYLDYRFTLLLIQIAAMIIIGFFVAFLPLFFAIMVGQLWQKHRILGAVGVYVGMGFITQFVNSFAIVALVSSSPSIGGYPNSLNIDYWIDRSYSIANSFLLTFLAIALVFNAGYFILTNYLMKHRLNLE